MYVSWKSQASFTPISFELQQNGNSRDSIYSFEKKLMSAEKIRHLLHPSLLSYRKMVTHVIASKKFKKTFELPFQFQKELEVNLVLWNGNEKLMEKPRNLPWAFNLSNLCFPCDPRGWSSSESQCGCCSWTSLLNVN